MDLVKGLTIRKAGTEDCSSVMDLLKESAQWMKDNGIQQWRFLLAGGDDEEIEQAIVNGDTYIVLDNDKAAATFTLLSKQSEWDKKMWGEDSTFPSVYLHRLALSPLYMNKGVGRELLGWMQHHLDGTEYLRLDCVADNFKLNAFYRNNGFELVGLEDGHSRYQMRL